MRDERRLLDKIAGSFIAFAVLVLVLSLLSLLMSSALKEEERRECLQWEQWSKEIRKDVFYLTPWQKEQCDAVGIEIDAPVKGGDNDKLGPDRARMDMPSLRHTKSR
jgi:hypothetical protein